MSTQEKRVGGKFQKKKQPTNMVDGEAVLNLRYGLLRVCCEAWSVSHGLEETLVDVVDGL